MEPAGRSVPIPWQGVLAVAAALGGIFLVFNPLDTSRPIERSVVGLKFDQPQDVDARLWQDPLLAANAHETQLKALATLAGQATDTRHVEGTICHTTEDLKAASYQILAVMIPGGPYAEYGELRLRARRAVLEGLGTVGFAPPDGEHIGYERANLRDNQELIVPFEWCERTRLVQEEGANGFSKVLVLWLRDEAFAKTPLRILDELFGKLKLPSDQVRLIGPLTSAGLRSMIQELVPGHPAGLLADAKLFCATPTASSDMLKAGTGVVDKPLEALFKDSKLDFTRLTATDTEVSARLVAELQRRGIDLKTGQTGTAPAKADHVVVISEWDTFYGRALPLSFARAASGRSLAELEREYPANILVYHYLRGIDGMLPGASGKEADPKADAEKKKSTLPRETTEGLNQADYLRRLAQQLQAKDEELKRNGQDGIKAVGVLGSDVYDKLLVLKALRKTLPGRVFFTNTLDARFGHPDEWHAARNLVVVTPFGLTLHPEFQGRIPPFRDSYQTAIYAATLRALGGAHRPIGPPRTYEIGRNGPYDLTPPEEPHQQSPPSQGAAASSASPPTLQPANPNRAGYLNRPRKLLLGGMILAAFGAVAWGVLVIGGLPRSLPLLPPRFRLQRKRSRWHAISILFRWSFLREKKTARTLQSFGGSSWVALTGFFLLFWALIYLPPDSYAGEPFAWFEGISVWPTEILRLTVAAMAAWFIRKTHCILQRNERDIQKDFHLKPPRKTAWPTPPFFSRLWWIELVKHLTLRYWAVEENDLVNAQKLWDRYIESGRLGSRLRRIAPLIVLFLVAGVCLMAMLGFPPVPARGGWSQAVDKVALFLSVFGSVSLTFFIVDATLLNRRLIHYLVKSKTHWPEGAYTNCRKRWNLPLPDKPVETPADDLLVDYLDIDLIAKRTAVVGELIYYPFVLISLMIVSRIGIFDNWTWPLPLLLVIGFNGGYAAWSAVRLRRTAENARKTALGRLNDQLIAYIAGGRGDDEEAATIRETSAMIRAEERGAFAAISRHPVFGALLLPSGGAGIWALSQYLPGLF